LSGVDFAFVDGWHTFDHVLVDFFYIDRLLRVGGIVVFDDASMPAIHRICRYIATNRQYRFCAEAGGGRSKRLAPQVLCWVTRQSATFGRLVKSRFSKLDEELGFFSDSDLIAFEKISDDTRN
jgi:hypothetical protein